MQTQDIPTLRTEVARANGRVRAARRDNRPDEEVAPLVADLTARRVELALAKITAEHPMTTEGRKRVMGLVCATEVLS